MAAEVAGTGAGDAPAAVGGVVRTVTGDVDPSELGVTLMHEHMIVDYASNFGPPEEGTSRAELGLLSADDRKAMWEAPMSAGIAGHCRCYFSSNRDNMVLDDVDAIVEEAGRFKAIGGSSVVECTIEGIGRNPAALRAVAEGSGLNVIMGTGFYLARVHPPGTAERTVDDFADMFVREIRDGVEVEAPSGGTMRIKAGIIGELGCTTELQPAELKILQGAAAAQKVTGATISIHPGYSAEAPSEILDVLEKAGADLARVVMGHVDRGILTFDDMLAVVERGTTVEFDQFGWDHSFAHALAYGIDYPSDYERCKTIKRLIAAGHGERVSAVAHVAAVHHQLRRVRGGREALHTTTHIASHLCPALHCYRAPSRPTVSRCWQIVVSHDLAFKTRLARFGGTSYDYINRSIVPYMLKLGITEEQVRTIQVDTPRRLLTLPRT